MPETTTGEHPRFRWLLDHADGVLSGRRAELVTEHLDTGCRACARELREIEELRDAVTAGPLPPPPAAVMHAAAQLFPRHRLRETVDRAVRLVASLVFDQREQFAPALRSTTDVRRLLWTVGAFELFVTFDRVDGRTVVRGQFLPLDDGDAALPAGSITLEHDRSGESFAAPLDNEGEFVLRGLPEGTYLAHGRIDGVDFGIPPFVID